MTIVLREWVVLSLQHREGDFLCRRGGGTANRGSFLSCADGKIFLYLLFFEYLTPQGPCRTINVLTNNTFVPLLVASYFLLLSTNHKS
jgi:hypothetical protein